MHKHCQDCEAIVTRRHREARLDVQISIFGFEGSMAQWLSWLERRPVTAEVTGSSPVWVVCRNREANATNSVTATQLLSTVPTSWARHNGRLAQLGEHLPYKQRVIGSSPIAPIVRIAKQS